MRHLQLRSTMERQPGSDARHELSRRIRFVFLLIASAQLVTVASPAGASEMPSVPVLGSPASGAIFENPAPEFDWASASDTPSACLEYQLLVAIPRWGLTAISVRSTSTRFLPGPDEALVGTPGETLEYDWKVRARFCGGEWSAWSDESRFSIATPEGARALDGSPSAGADGRID